MNPTFTGRSRRCRSSTGGFLWCGVSRSIRGRGLTPKTRGRRHCVRYTWGVVDTNNTVVSFGVVCIPNNIIIITITTIGTSIVSQQVI